MENKKSLFNPWKLCRTIEKGTVCFSFRVNTLPSPQRPRFYLKQHLQFFQVYSSICTQTASFFASFRVGWREGVAYCKEIYSGILSFRLQSKGLLSDVDIKNTFKLHPTCRLDKEHPSNSGRHVSDLWVRKSAKSESVQPFH